MNYNCILLAAGEGQRAALGYNKVLYKINGKREMILYSLDYFLNDQDCKKIILVINKRDELYLKNLIKNNKVKFTYGGANRGESVSNGLKMVDSEFVLIHDSARPLIYKEDIINLLSQAKEYNGATLATKVYNTTCHMTDGFVDEYFSRSSLASVITPQAFNTKFLKEAYEKADGKIYTDDSSIFKACGRNVKLVFTDNISIKATTPYDIKLLEVLLYENR